MDYLARKCIKKGLRIVEYSIQGNHIHMICEAMDSEALTKAMMGIMSGLARVLNSHWGRRGDGDLGARTVFTFHVWVDPIYGDDTQARAKNPTGLTTNLSPNKALSRHLGLDRPLATPPDPWPGRIVIAPFSFRTVTKALNYVATEFQNPAVPNDILWGFVDNQINGDGKTYTVNRIVIHCLPGLYGTGTAIEPRAGLRYNGETFPLKITPDVSIQGTSALDTVFDAQEAAGFNIFQFIGGFSDQVTHAHNFIDGVTIRGARAKDPDNQFAIRTGAGVMIADLNEGQSNMQPVISNCFITNNDVGIAIDASPNKKELGNPPEPYGRIHSPIIVNNTIAWNRIGIWSGQMANHPAIPNTVNKGFGRPRLFNNIIDSGDPNSKFAGGTSCFEGLDRSDLTILSAGGTTLNLDFNAYELGRFNLITSTTSTILPAGWNKTWMITQPRTAGQVYAPRRNLTPWTLATPRKFLYINETLASFLGAFNVENSLSPHDFRLTMHPEAGNSALSPLTDLGIDLSQGVLRFQNWHVTRSPDITYAPGLKSPGAQNQGYDSDYAELHAWDNDCEGFGNPRIHDRPDVPNQAGITWYSFLDLGADEMGDLIMAGYIDRTRIFSELTDMGGGAPPFNLTAYFIGIANTNYPRPLYWQETGRSMSTNLNQTQQVTGWWDYATRLPPAVRPYPGPTPATSHTIEGMDVAANPTVMSDRRALVNATTAPYEDFMRNLECDFSPSLLPDMHPVWALWGNNNPDVFAANPWYHHQAGPFGTWDNKELYYLPSLGYAPVSGHINPPGTKEYDSQMGYLVGYGAVFGPYSGGQPLTYNTNQWGLGDATGFDWVPSTGGAGVRMNCEVFPAEGPAGANIQTFLIVENSVVPLSATSTKTKKAPTTKFPKSATLAQLRAAQLKIRQRVIKSLKK